MKRYSIAPPSSSRRKSTHNKDDVSSARQILEQLDQDTTFVLQEIDRNISRANSIINDKIKPTIQDYAVESLKLWENGGFWKHFFEQSANIELNTYEDPVDVENSGDEIENEREIPLIEFKKPLLKHDEETPTWSIDQKSNTPKSKEKHQTDLMAQKPSPVKIHTIRQSLDAYHRLSMSPRKQQELQGTPKNNRRSSIIQSILNSSPTFPEPPVLKSEIGMESSNIVTSSSPKKSNELQKFPDTPKFSRLSGGSIRKDDTTTLKPPQLNDRGEEEQESLSLKEPELNTLKRSYGSPNSEHHKRIRAIEESNIFLEKKSPIHSNDNSNHSKSKFDAALRSLKNQIRPPNDDGINQEIITDVSINLRDKDLTENSTADLGPLKERWERFSTN